MADHSDDEDMTTPFVGECEAGDDGWTSSEPTTDEECGEEERDVKPEQEGEGDEEVEDAAEARRRRQQKLLAFLAKTAEIKQRMRERREAEEAAATTAGSATASGQGSCLEPQEEGGSGGNDVSRLCRKPTSEGKDDVQDAERPSTATSVSTDTTCAIDGGKGEGASSRPSAGFKRDQITENLDKLRRMKEMCAQLESASAMCEEAKISAYLSACQKYDGEDYQGAIEGFNEVVRLNYAGAPTVSGLDDAEVYLMRGQAKARLGDVTGGIDDLTEAVRGDPKCANAWFQRGSMRSDSGDPRGAEEDFTKVLRLEPENTEAWCCRGTTRFILGDAEGALNDGSEAIAVDENCANAYGLRGVVRIRLGDHQGGAEDCERALELDASLEWVRPAFDEARRHLGVDTLSVDDIQAGNPEDARRAFEIRDGMQVRKDLPADLADTASPCRTWGNALFREGKLRAAAAAYGEAYRAREDGWLLAISNKAICHLKLEEYNEAVEAADKCLEEDGAPHKAYFTKFKGLAALGDWPGAFKTMQVLRAKPDLPKELLAVIEKEEREKRMEYEVLRAAEAAGLPGANSTSLNQMS